MGLQAWTEGMGVDYGNASAEEWADEKFEALEFGLDDDEAKVGFGIRVGRLLFHSNKEGCTHQGERAGGYNKNIEATATALRKTKTLKSMIRPPAIARLLFAGASI